MKKPETKFKERVLGDLHRLPRTWVTKIQQVSLRGTPDILACINGVFVALELKRSEKAKVDKLQLYTLGQIAEAGGVGVVTYPENWSAVLDELCEKLLDGVPLGPDAKSH